LVKARGAHLDPAMLAACQMVCGWVPLVVLGCALEGSPWHLHWTGQAVFSVLYLALAGSALAFCMMYWLLRRIQATKIMLISLVTPVAAVLIGAWWLHERLTEHAIAGGGCVLIGLFLVIARRTPRPEAVALPAAVGQRGH
jgi:drug/metabolite transporter (DMT)-like permease